MKNNFLNKIIIATVCLIACLSAFTSCEKDDAGNQVVLQAFGPCPVMRGGDLTIVGNNLDKVTAVVLPGCPDITNITHVSSTDIKVTVPQEATEGHIAIKYAGGEIVSKAMLSFTEPYVITTIAPTDKALREGDAVTITGDYLWNIVSVVFSGNETEARVDSVDFTQQDRKTIVLNVPRGAASGKIKIVDEPGNELYSDQELTIKQPVITKISPLKIKVGSDLTIEGTDLDLISSVAFMGGTSVDTAQFKSQTATKLVLPVPADAHDGIVTVIAYSLIESASKEAIELTVPNGLKVMAPDRFKAGKTVEITGTDLDLVTRLLFANDVEVETFTNANGKITATIPATAVDGAISLMTAAEKWVSTDAITLVKPVITGFSPAEIIAGESFKVNGTDLDLVISVKVGSNACEIKAQSATELTITTPLNATSGNIELTIANKNTVVSSSAITINPSTKPTVTSMPSSAKPGDQITLKGTNLNNVKTTLFGTVAVSKYVVRTATELTFTIPQNAPKGKQKIKFELYEGADVETDQEIALGGVDPVFDESYVFFDFNGTGNKDSWWGSFGKVENDPNLSLDGTSYFRINQNLTGGWVDFFWRNAANNLKTDGVTVAGWVIKMDVNVLGPTTPPFKFRLKGKDGDFWCIFGGLENQGGWYTVSIPLADFVDKDGWGTTHLPNVQNVDSDFGLALAGEGETNICIDNVRFEPK